MKVALGAIGTTTGAIVAIPSILSAFTPVFKKRDHVLWRSLGPLENFKVGSTSKANVEVEDEEWSQTLRKKGVYVWRPKEDEVVVFSRSCTDLGCPINYDPGSGWFFCPCHGGIFDQEGERRAGPPKRALYRYEKRIRNGELEIDLRSLPPMT